MKPKCKLIGQDGNVFYIIGRVSKTLEQNNIDSSDFKNRVYRAKSYDEALQIVMEHVEVE